jgi:hypothetical protein
LATVIASGAASFATAADEARPQPAASAVEATTAVVYNSPETFIYC